MARSRTGGKLMKAITDTLTLGVYLQNGKKAWPALARNSSVAGRKVNSRLLEGAMRKRRLNEPLGANSINFRRDRPMNAKIATIMGALILSASVFASTAFAKDVSYNPMSPASEATSLIGKEVIGQAGEYLGNISNLIIDEANDRVSLVVLTGVPGFGSDQVSFPYECLQRTGDQTFTIHFSGTASAVDSGQDPVLHVLKLYPADSPLYNIPEPIAPNWVAEVYRTYGYLPYWVQPGEKAPSASDLSETTHFVGTKVAATEGKVSATIDDMTIDSSGHLDLLLLSGVPNRGSHEVAVPFEELKKTSDGSLVLNVTGRRLAMAPVFYKYDVNRMGYDQRVDRFFGLSPRWAVKPQAENDPYRWGGDYQGF